MNNVSVQDFLPDLMPRLPGAEEELVMHETFAAIREFCEDGQAWIETLPSVSSKANNPNIYLNPQPDGRVVGYVKQVLFVGAGTVSATSNSNGFRKLLTPITTVPAFVTTGQEPTAYMMADTGHLVLNPIPTLDHTKSYTIDISLIPTNVKARLPQEFLTHHRDAIISGVCSRMMLMISKPWSNPTTALYHGKRFRNFVKRSRALTNSKYSPGAGWRFPDFAMQRFGSYTGGGRGLT